MVSIFKKLGNDLKKAMEDTKKDVKKAVNDTKQIFEVNEPMLKTNETKKIGLMAKDEPVKQCFNKKFYKLEEKDGFYVITRKPD